MMPPNSRYKLEICVETPAALEACAQVADRIELCAGLDVGGLTPSMGLMQQAKALGVETHVLIRPRCGDFKMTPADLEIAVADIRAVRDLGLHGVVIGAELAGALDQAALHELVQAAAGIDLTLHRVIDVLDNPIAAMETAIELGFVRILTSGGAQSAPEGIAGLARMHNAAAGRIEIMAGAGINSQNVDKIMEQSEITSFHASCSAKASLGQRYVEFGFGEAARTFDKGELARLSDRLTAKAS